MNLPTLHRLVCFALVACLGIIGFSIINVQDANASNNPIKLLQTPTPTPVPTRVPAWRSQYTGQLPRGLHRTAAATWAGDPESQAFSDSCPEDIIVSAGDSFWKFEQVGPEDQIEGNFIFLNAIQCGDNLNLNATATIRKPDGDQVSISQTNPTNENFVLFSYAIPVNEVYTGLSLTGKYVLSIQSEGRPEQSHNFYVARPNQGILLLDENTLELKRQFTVGETIHIAYNNLKNAEIGLYQTYPSEDSAVLIDVWKAEDAVERIPITEDVPAASYMLVTCVNNCKLDVSNGKFVTNEKYILDTWFEISEPYEQPITTVQIFEEVDPSLDLPDIDDVTDDYLEDPQYVSIKEETLNQLRSIGEADGQDETRIIFELSSNLTVEAEIRNFVRRDSTTSITAHLLGNEFDLVNLVVSDNGLIGNLVVDNVLYQIRTFENNTHIISKVDQTQLEEELEPDPPPVENEADEDFEPPLLQNVANPVVDVMVVYTQNVEENSNDIDADIALAIAETNSSFSNSQINVGVNLVHSEKVNYSESGDLVVDRDRLRITNDNFLDDVHDLRDEHGADIVVLWIESGGGCGIAHIMKTVSTSMTTSAFAVVKRECATGKFTFGHELGHILGARHDCVQDATLNSPYSFNHGFTSPEGQDPWRTMMAYNTACKSEGFSCPRIPFWSNPNMERSSSPMGQENLGMCSANNHKTLNNTAQTVASFKTRPETPLPKPPSKSQTTKPTEPPSLEFTCEDSVVSTDECKVLISIYDDTNGVEWKSKQDWLDTDNHCTWNGVTCNGNFITQLYLSNNNLNGTLSQEIGGLSELVTLDLEDNNLSGPIPSSLGNLGKLQTLLLTNNDISGPVPEQLGQLSELIHLRLGNNDLHGSIPTSIGNLGKLQSLYLYEFMDDDEDSNARLDGEILASLMSLSSTLKQLSLHGQNFSGQIPPGLGDFKNLIALYLDNNNFTGKIPSQLGNMTALRNLRLSDNEFEGKIPSELGNLTELTELMLGGNALHGSIPESLGNLGKLRVLSLYGSSDDSDARLDGKIPESLMNLSDTLERLNLHNQQLSGTIPKGLGDFQKLISLFLNNNNLTGNIPLELGNLAALEKLIVENNQLSGNIPRELGQLSELVDLRLGNNNLSGEIPESLGDLDNLRILYLYDSLDDSDLKLDGKIPDSFMKLSDTLEQLSLHSQNLSGSIPEKFGDFQNLTHLYLDNNDLTGAVPNTLGNLTALQRFRLNGNNQLEGTVPIEFGKLENLSNLRIQETKICVPNDEILKQRFESNDSWISSGIDCPE